MVCLVLDVLYSNLRGVGRGRECWESIAQQRQVELKAKMPTYFTRELCGIKAANHVGWLGGARRHRRCFKSLDGASHKEFSAESFSVRY